MCTSRLLWTSVLLVLLLVVGCGAPERGAGDAGDRPTRAAVDSLAEISVAGDSVAGRMDTVARVERDSLRNPQDPKGGDPKRNGKKPPPSGWVLGAPNDVLPSLSRNEGIPMCKPGFALIRAVWRRDAASGLYSAGNDSIGGLRAELPKMHDCLYCLPKADAVTLFGKPSKVVGSDMLYYLTRPCLGMEGAAAAGCECLKVELAVTGVVKRVYFVGGAGF